VSIRAVHHLNCATMCPIGAFLLGQRGLGRGRLVAHCLLVETERDGLVLIDTGLGTRDIAGQTRMPWSFRKMVGPRLDPGETAVAQIVALALDPKDVRNVVITHLDLDHAGGLSDFPEARIHLHAREHAAAMTRSHRVEKGRYLPDQWAHGPHWELYTEDGDTWRGVPAINRLRGLNVDIGLVPMHGHTRGHSAVIVRAADRWLLHAGDAYYHRGSIEGSGSIPIGLLALERHMQMAPIARRASVAALRQLRERYDDVDLFCSHDPDEFEAIRQPAPSASADRRSVSGT
jgi:glyoxylase-like metal-dependent hydrolase (beta-lactamase superfamily II)